MKTSILLLTFFSLGCAQLNFVRNEVAQTREERLVTFTHERMLFGFVSLTPRDAALTACGQSRVESLKLKTTFAQHLVTGFSLGIYVPQTLEVTCR